ncbi:MAG: SurA N-terminal domain-containing protein [Actinomycetota bacterium]
MTKKWLLSLAVAGSIAVLTACGGAPDDGGASPAASAESSAGAEGQAQMPEPDLKDIPDVVAEVNGTKITKDKFTAAYEGQFQQMAMQSQMTGQEVDQDALKKQTAEAMVGTQLLIQEADQRGIKAPQKDVDAELEKMAKSNDFKTVDELLAAIKKQGMDENEVNAEMQTQVKVNKLIAEEAGDTKPSEKELKAAYDQAKQQQEAMGEQSGQKAEMPSMKEMRPNLEEQVKAQKETEATQALVTDLREKADVKIHL